MPLPHVHAAARCTLIPLPFPRLIAHLDMDAFYASVELLRYPELRGRPVVIGGGSRHHPVETLDASGAMRRTFSTLRGYAGRGVITTATYEARALGLSSAMGMMKASSLAPEAVLLPVDFDAYRRHSRAFKSAVRAICPLVEDRGIDEIYVDLTALVQARLASARVTAASAAPSADEAWRHARCVAASMKQAVREATGLGCSVAVAPNKLLAKIGSELDKPDGLTLVTEADVPTRIWPLAVRRINGIGPKSNAKLEALGIRTIAELANADPALLVANFGRSHGTWMHEAAHGRDDRPVVTWSEPKSISRETTFERDLHARRDRDELSEIFTRLCVGVSEDLQRKGYSGRTIGLKLRYEDFRTVTRDHTLADPIHDAPSIRRAAGECLKRVALQQRIRLLGVRVGSLHPSNAPWAGRRMPAAGSRHSLFD
jgi:DNA polymerase IV